MYTFVTSSSATDLCTVSMSEVEVEKPSSTSSDSQSEELIASFFRSHICCMSGVTVRSCLGVLIINLILRKSNVSLNKHYLVQSFVECNPSVAASGFQIQQVSPLKLFQTFRRRLAPSVYRSHANLKDRQSHIL